MSTDRSSDGGVDQAPRMASAAAAMMAAPVSTEPKESRYRVTAPPRRARRLTAEVPPLPPIGVQAPAEPEEKSDVAGPRDTGEAEQDSAPVARTRDEVLGPVTDEARDIATATGPQADVAPVATDEVTEPASLAAPASPTAPNLDPEAPAVMAVRPTTDVFGRGRDRLVQVGPDGEPLPRTGRHSTAVSLSPRIRDAWLSYAHEAGFTKNEVLMDAFDDARDVVADLVLESRRKVAPQRANTLFRRPVQGPGEKGADANVTVPLRMQGMHLDVIDALVKESDADSRSHLVSLVLERFLKEQGAL